MRGITTRLGWDGPLMRRLDWFLFLCSYSEKCWESLTTTARASFNPQC